MTKSNRSGENEFRPCSGPGRERRAAAVSENVHGHQRAGGGPVCITWCRLLQMEGATLWAVVVRRRGWNRPRWSAATGKKVDCHGRREGDEFLAGRCQVVEVDDVARELPLPVGDGYGRVVDTGLRRRKLIWRRLKWCSSKTSSTILKPDLKQIWSKDSLRQRRNENQFRIWC